MMDHGGGPVRVEGLTWMDRINGEEQPKPIALA
jgi:hypothetical protein